MIQLIFQQIHLTLDIYIFFYQDSQNHIILLKQKQITNQQIPVLHLNSMDLINIASSKHKCQIIKASSCQNQQLHPPSCLIQQNKDSVWVSGEGLPQQIIINLQQIEYPYQYIIGIAFTCNHDYQTNPKIIQIWTARNKQWLENGQFIQWDKVEMKKKRGRQMFSISQIPQSQRIIKIKITQTYGQYLTYLNQIMLLVEPDHHSSQSLINQQEWQRINQSPVNTKFNQNNTKNSKNKNKKLRTTTQDRDSRFNQLSPLQLLGDVDEDYYNNIQSRNKYKHKNLQLQDIQDHQNQQHAQMITISKNMIIMQDNIEQLTRKVEVLQKKIEYTYQSLQKNILKKVQQMVDRKIQRQLSKKQLLESQQLQHNKQKQQQLKGRKLKSSKDLTTSRTMNNLRNIGSKQKQHKVLGLVSQLNDKLKQRSKLANKLQKRLQLKTKSQYYN